jgi:threonine aldolase
MIIDLRSDTFTKPSREMREAMAYAEVGDDVFAEDPTVNRLQDLAAQMFGHEAALYCSSGTQTNQIAIQVHTRPGDEIICSSTAHVYLYEGGGIAKNSGSSVRLIEGNRGRINASQVRENINNSLDVHLPLTTLVCLEDTSNKGGGSVYDINDIYEIKQVCDQHHLRLHLDGARVFNALEKTGIAVSEYARHFDSISICLSKGLGAPIGSVLIGSKDFIKKAHRARKAFGGGMRQAGIIAAAGIYALENNIKRLREDHDRAKSLGQILSSISWVKDIMPIETNIVIFELIYELDAKSIAEKMASIGILCFPFGPKKIRLVTHLDVNDTHIEAFDAQIKKLTI